MRARTQPRLEARWLAIAALCAAPAAAGTVADSVAVGSAAGVPAPDSAAGIDYLWVLRGSLASRAELDSVVPRAVRLGARGLLVQVVGRGDACYRSDLLPRAEFLPADPGFDPLGELLPRAHAAGLEVHAWVDCLLAWSSPHPPRAARHVMNAHPEWIARLRDGRRMSALGMRERRRAGVEGVFLSAGHPAVQAWIGSIAREIVTRYPVDGVHLDYIRDPGPDAGWDPTSCARFALQTGVDPRRIGGLPPAQRDSLSDAWRRFQRDQVTAVVRSVRDSIAGVRPGIELTAAVIADTTRAERDDSQMWRDWLEDGLLDRAFLMCYGPDVQEVMDQLSRFASELDRARLVPGIAMFNATPVAAALKIEGARALGFPRVALYSYDSLVHERHYLEALGGQLAHGARGTP